MYGTFKNKPVNWKHFRQMHRGKTWERKTLTDARNDIGCNMW